MQKSIFNNINLYIIFGITLFAVMGVSSLTPAFPLIIEHFSLIPQDITLLITVFTLPGIFLTPIMGMLADRYGRKTILVPAMLLFGIAGMLCALQKSYELLLMMRFFQGVGAASLGALNVTLIGDIFKGKDRIQAMGYNASVLSIGTASFPAIGGFLAAAGWYYPFVLPVLILPIAILVLFKLETPHVRNEISFSTYLGNVWRTINRKKVWGLFSVNILLFVILYGALLSFFPIFMKTHFQADSVQIGMSMSAMSLTTAIFSSQLGRVRKKLGAHHLMILSAFLYAAALVAISFSTNWIFLIAAIVVFGMAHGLFIPNVQTSLVSMAPLSERAAFMSLNGMVLRIGQTLGPVIASLFYINNNTQPVFWFAASVALFMILIIVLFVGPIEEPA